MKRNGFTLIEAILTFTLVVFAVLLFSALQVQFRRNYYSSERKNWMDSQLNRLLVEKVNLKDWSGPGNLERAFFDLNMQPGAIVKQGSDYPTAITIPCDRAPNSPTMPYSVCFELVSFDTSTIVFSDANFMKIPTTASSRASSAVTGELKAYFFFHPGGDQQQMKVSASMYVR